MSASENQAAEARRDTSSRKIGPTGNKIRIRLPLPLRKRLAEGLQTISTGLPEDTKKHAAKEESEYTDDTVENTTFIDTKLKIEKASTKPPSIKLSADGNLKTMSKDGLCEQANSNSLCKTMSKARVCEEANFIVPELNLTTTAGMQDNTESICPVRKGSCEEGHTDIMSNGLPPESSKTSKKETCVGATDKTPSMELSITRVQGEVEKNDSITKPCEAASENILSKKLLYETNSNTSRKRGSVERQMTVSQSDNPLINLMTRNYAKKLRTSAVQATDTSQNTSGLKLPTSVGLAMEQSTSTPFLEATKVYKEFEEKVKRTVYLDNLSHLATDAVITMALNQFGNVKNVSFLTNYTVPFDIPQSALIEMETDKDAESVVNILHEFPFILSGMPRPVRAKHATAEMFNDHPRNLEGRKNSVGWALQTLIVIMSESLS
ncbi:unnamed protein product [Miscanthus lutarioriparius]|uniref:RRM domain-containing protein n=1 Tax=Miscanthus lutarioriparius TaxID=422564 RepID=A0A811NMC7_9POAL|nr:unnamed protein product [Miscanthus lutarioriparius]